MTDGRGHKRGYIYAARCEASGAFTITHKTGGEKNSHGPSHWTTRPASYYGKRAIETRLTDTSPASGNFLKA